MQKADIQRIMSNFKQRNMSSQSRESDQYIGGVHMKDEPTQGVDVAKDLSQSVLNFVNAYGLKV